MSGLYNVAMGWNQLAPVCLKMLNLEHTEVGRFRDAHLRETDKEGAVIVVVTRTGGGNREAYEENNRRLQEHPEYLHDADDTYDNTYAEFVFKVPTQYAEDITALLKLHPEAAENRTLGQRFDEALERIKETMK